MLKKYRTSGICMKNTVHWMCYVKCVYYEKYSMSNVFYEIYCMSGISWIYCLVFMLCKSTVCLVFVMKTTVRLVFLGYVVCSGCVLKNTVHPVFFNYKKYTVRVCPVFLAYVVSS